VLESCTVCDDPKGAPKPPRRSRTSMSMSVWLAIRACATVCEGGCHTCGGHWHAASCCQDKQAYDSHSNPQSSHRPCPIPPLPALISTAALPLASAPVSCLPHPSPTSTHTTPLCATLLGTLVSGSSRSLSSARLPVTIRSFQPPHHVRPLAVPSLKQLQAGEQLQG
jgi:hypothetical protein